MSFFSGPRLVVPKRGELITHNNLKLYSVGYWVPFYGLMTDMMVWMMVTLVVGIFGHKFGTLLCYFYDYSMSRECNIHLPSIVGGAVSRQSLSL